MLKEKNLYKFIVVFIILFCILSLFYCGDIITYAETPTSDVITDLSKDTSFSVDNYPVIDNDSSLKFINIAETNSNELAIYLYNPDGKRKASSINISASIDNTLHINNYKLELIDRNGTLSKYIVLGLKLPKGDKRYYSIPAVYRPFDSAIDSQPENGNIKTEVAYPISKDICIYEENGETKSIFYDVETIEITDKFVGYVSYSNGFTLLPSNCNSHFVAFNTDKPIDKLLEADVYYTTQSYNKAVNYNAIPEPITSYKFDKIVEHHKTLKYTDKVTHTGSGIAAPTYTWNRIETVENFIKNEDITQNVYYGATFDVNVGNHIKDEALTKLQAMQWILRFDETKSESMSYNGVQSLDATIVGNVSILRLKFDTSGVIYNLGVVDNKTSTPSEEPPINDETTDVVPLSPDEILRRTTERFLKIFQYILGAVLVVVLAIIVIALLPVIIKLIVWIITSPYNLYKLIYDSIKRREQKKGADK